MTLEDRIASSGPKRILALDGGGIRGMIAVEVLAALEKALASKHPAGDKFVLADFFDFAAGTSTGAIIAACVAMGMPMAEVRKFYISSGQQMFDKASILKRFHKYKYRDEPLAGKLKEVIGADTLLGSDRLRTVLMMVMRNVSTDSAWPVSNNPHAKYNHRDHPDCNLNIPLWQLIRASTAAPTFFPPELVDLGKREFIFVDGGITSFNNPAFKAFLMATVEPYGMNWPTGVDKMLLVSIGTGRSPAVRKDLDPEEMNLLFNAKTLPDALMYGALNEQDMLCRSFGECLVGDALDREVGTMIGARGPVDRKLFRYLRYNVELSREGLGQLGLDNIAPEAVRALDSVDNIDALRRIGETIAQKKLQLSHYLPYLNA